MSNIVISGGSAQMNINGMNISVRSGRVFINGQEWGPKSGDSAELALTAPLSPEVFEGFISAGTERITIIGEIAGDVILTSPKDGPSAPISIQVEGDVHGSVQADGDVSCRNIGANASAGGNLETRNIGGSATAGGKIDARNVGGSTYSHAGSSRTLRDDSLGDALGDS